MIATVLFGLLAAYCDAAPFCWKSFNGEKYKGVVLIGCKTIGSLFMRHDDIETSVFMTYIRDRCDSAYKTTVDIAGLVGTGRGKDKVGFWRDHMDVGCDFPCKTSNPPLNQFCSYIFLPNRVWPWEWCRVRQAGIRFEGYHQTGAYAPTWGWWSPDDVLRRSVEYMANFAGFECEVKDKRFKFTQELQGMYMISNQFVPARTEFVFYTNTKNFVFRIYPDIHYKVDATHDVKSWRAMESISFRDLKGDTVKCTNYFNDESRKNIQKRYA